MNNSDKADTTVAFGFAGQAARSALWTGLSQYWLFGLGVVKTVILARLVPPEWFGIVALAQVWVSYLSFLKFDFQTAVVTWDESPQVLTMQFWLENMMTLSGVLLAGILYLWTPGIVSTPIWAAIFILLGATVFEALTSTPRYLTQKRLRQDIIGRLTVFHSLLGLGVAVILAWRGYYLAALLADILIPIFVLGGGLALIVRWQPQRLWNGKVARDLLSYSFTLWSAGLLGKVIFQLDDWLVGTIQRSRSRVWLSSGVLSEAFYSRAYVAGKMPMDVFAAFISLIALPLYSRSESAGREVLRHIYRRTTWLLTYLIFFSSTFALVATEEVVTIVLGENWLPTVPLFRLMSLFIFLRPLFQNASQALLAMHREKDMRRATGYQALFIAVACPPAVYFWGAAGAAVIVSIMTVIGLIAAERYVRIEMDVQMWSIYLLPSLTSVTLIVFLGLADSSLPENIWLSVLIKGCVCVLLFAGIVIARERTRAREVWQLLRDALRAQGQEKGDSFRAAP